MMLNQPLPISLRPTHKRTRVRDGTSSKRYVPGARHDSGSRMVRWCGRMRDHAHCHRGSCPASDPRLGPLTALLPFLQHICAVKRARRTRTEIRGRVCRVSVCISNCIILSRFRAPCIQITAKQRSLASRIRRSARAPLPADHRTCSHRQTQSHIQALARSTSPPVPMQRYRKTVASSRPARATMPLSMKSTSSSPTSSSHDGHVRLCWCKMQPRRVLFVRHARQFALCTA
jgi:hypothetical protein